MINSVCTKAFGLPNIGMKPNERCQYFRLRSFAFQEIINPDFMSERAHWQQIAYKVLALPVALLIGLVDVTLNLMKLTLGNAMIFLYNRLYNRKVVEEKLSKSAQFISHIRQWAPHLIGGLATVLCAYGIYNYRAEVSSFFSSMLTKAEKVTTDSVEKTFKQYLAGQWTSVVDTVKHYGNSTKNATSDFFCNWVGYSC